MASESAIHDNSHNITISTQTNESVRVILQRRRLHETYQSERCPNHLALVSRQNCYLQNNVLWDKIITLE